MLWRQAKERLQDHLEETRIPSWNESLEWDWVGEFVCKRWNEEPNLSGSRWHSWVGFEGWMGVMEIGMPGMKTFKTEETWLLGGSVG